MKNYIFYYVWRKKGKIKGIHNEFGKCSFMGIPEISDHYFLDREEKIELLLELQDYYKKIDNL